MKPFETLTPKSLSVQLLKGKEVIDLLREEKFQYQWDELYQTCPWATVFQSYEFVSTWYSLFQDQYLPILLKSEMDGSLVGLLTLAIKINRESKGKLFIVAAGHGEADCQTWISTISLSTPFIKNALREVLKHFPNDDIMIRHVPPLVPLEWAIIEKPWKKCCTIQSFRRPILQMKDFSISKRNRKRINRLKNIGTYESLSDLEKFSTYLDDLTLLFDFRQGAMFNRTPFRENHTYKNLLLGLFEKKLLKATVFKVENEIVAALIVIIGKKIAHIGGINVHSPLYSDYSPGFIQFLLLGQDLVKEQVAYLDLTPGDDEFKERLATTFDHVNTLIVTNKTSFLYKRRLRMFIHNSLSKAGIRPLSLKLTVEKRMHLLSKKGVFSQVSLFLKNNFKPTGQEIFKINPDSFGYNEAIEICKNNFAHLLEFNYQKDGLTKWEFLESSMKNFEMGKEVLSYSQNGVLQILIWFHLSNNERDATRCIVLQGLYCTPTSEILLIPFLAEVANFLSKEFIKETIYLISDYSTGKILKSRGLHPESSGLPLAIQKSD